MVGGWWSVVVGCWLVGVAAVAIVSDTESQCLCQHYAEMNCGRSPRWPTAVGNRGLQKNPREPGTRRPNGRSAKNGVNTAEKPTHRHSRHNPRIAMNESEEPQLSQWRAGPKTVFSTVWAIKPVVAPQRARQEPCLKLHLRKKRRFSAQFAHPRLLELVAACSHSSEDPRTAPVGSQRSSPRAG